VDTTASLFTDSLRAVGALAAVLGLLLLLVWSLRRAGVIKPTAGAGRLAVTGSLPLDSRNRLLLVRCDGREHLLALGPAGVRVIESQATLIPAPATTQQESS
jgi:flagellar protein FliO/FliZ